MGGSAFVAPASSRPSAGLAVAEVFGVEVGAGLAAGLGTGVGDQDDALAGEFEALAAADISAGDHFIHADHIGAGILEALAVFGAGAVRLGLPFGSRGTPGVG